MEDSKILYNVIFIRVNKNTKSITRELSFSHFWNSSFHIDEWVYGFGIYLQTSILLLARIRESF